MCFYRVSSSLIMHCESARSTVDHCSPLPPIVTLSPRVGHMMEFCLGRNSQTLPLTALHFISNLLLPHPTYPCPTTIRCYRILAIGCCRLLPFSPQCLVRLMGSSLGTNLGERGLASIDRNNKTTLLFTAPYRTIKSYAKDSSPRIVKLQDVS